MIRCAYSTLVCPSTLRPHPRNPNTHPSAQIEMLAGVIAESGWRHPIIVSKRSGYVVMGHGRLEAAILLGCETVPVDYQDFETEADELAAMVADNRLAELSVMDREALKDILCDLDTGEIDLDLTGYDSKALESILAPVNDPPTCPHCGGAL